MICLGKENVVLTEQLASDADGARVAGARRVYVLG